MSIRRGQVVKFGVRQLEVCWNQSGWFACDWTSGDSSGYYATSKMLAEAIESGEASFE